MASIKRFRGYVPFLLLALTGTAAMAEPIKVLFVGNSYTFGRVDPVMSYNAANVHDLTAAMWATNPAGSNSFEPHPWGGVPGIFKQFTVQAGLDYDVSLSTRNAASLRGHLLDTNAAGWKLSTNISSQKWDKLVLQEQSDEPLTKQAGLASNPAYFKTYTDLIEDWVHTGAAMNYREYQLIGGTLDACRAEIGASNNTACNAVRNIVANPNASASTQLYLYQTWARPNIVQAPFTTVTDETTGAVSFTSTPAPKYYPSLAAMTEDLRQAYAAAALQAGADGTGGITGISPVGESFMRAIANGVAMPDRYAAGAGSSGLLDLWFDDGTHASKYGSYLSALTLFGTMTGLDPLSLGAGEQAAFDLGITGAQALALQRVASEQLGFTAPVPEPATLGLMLGGLALLSLRKKVQQA